MDMTKGQITGLFLERLQIGRGKPAPLSDEVLRSGMKHQNVRFIILQLRYQLPDLKWGRRPEIAGPDETNPAVVHPGPRFSQRVPFSEDRSIGVKSGSQQHQQVVFRQKLHPGRFFGMEEGPVVISLNRY